MSVCVRVKSSGDLVVNNRSVEKCRDYVLISASEHKYASDLYSPTPEGIASAFSFGFGAVVVVGYLSSYAVGICKQLINKI